MTASASSIVVLNGDPNDGIYFQVRRPASGVVLLLNNCTDRTEQVARSVDVPFDLDVHSVLLPCAANAGRARRSAMDKAILSAGDGIVMTTDADAIAPPEWVALNAKALNSGADVVCGQAEIDPQDAALIPAHLHEDDALEREYADLLDAIADLLCPDPAAPRPRHTVASGASLAMTADAYLQAGGVPQVSSGEDHALIKALSRIDARIRHNPAIRIVISGRFICRAEGGMADTIRRRLIHQDVFTDESLEPPADGLLSTDLIRKDHNTAIREEFVPALMSIRRHRGTGTNSMAQSGGPPPCRSR